MINAPPRRIRGQQSFCRNCGQFFRSVGTLNSIGSGLSLTVGFTVAV